MTRLYYWHVLKSSVVESVLNLSLSSLFLVSKETQDLALFRLARIYTFKKALVGVTEM
jgi:hypothetical protein